MFEQTVYTETSLQQILIDRGGGALAGVTALINAGAVAELAHVWQGEAGGRVKPHVYTHSSEMKLQGASGGGAM